MSQITKRYGLLAALLAAATLTACDPYPSENTSAAVVNGASVIDAAFNGGIKPVEGTQGANNAWTVPNFSQAAFADLTDPTDPIVGSPAIVIQLNQLLGNNAALIEPTPGECAPVNPQVLTITPAGDWFACYYPSSGAPSLGPSIYVFQGDPTDLTTATIPVGTTHITGSVPTARGSAAVDVTVVRVD